MGFADVTVEARWNAVAEVGSTTLSLWPYVVDGGGVGPAVSAGILPSSEDGGAEALARDFLTKEVRAINLVLHLREGRRFLSLCR